MKELCCLGAGFSQKNLEGPEKAEEANILADGALREAAAQAALLSQQALSSDQDLNETLSLQATALYNAQAWQQVLRAWPAVFAFFLDWVGKSDCTLNAQSCRSCQGEEASLRRVGCKGARSAWTHVS